MKRFYNLVYFFSRFICLKVINRRKPLCYSQRRVDITLDFSRELKDPDIEERVKNTVFGDNPFYKDLYYSFYYNIKHWGQFNTFN